MDEASKTKKIRPIDFDRYFNGRGIDIGSGMDLIHPNAEKFDKEDGDANCITNFRIAGSYDFVHSSHCLEHMHNPYKAFSEWSSLLKSGGYMILVVPHEDLYEQGQWPSLFNDDHKHSFRIGSYDSWSPVSVNIFDLIDNNIFKIVSLEIHQNNLDKSLILKPMAPIKRSPFMENIFYKFSKLIFLKFISKFILGKYMIKNNIPIDQTRLNALAQIQIVLQRL